MQMRSAFRAVEQERMSERAADLGIDAPALLRRHASHHLHELR